MEFNADEADGEREDVQKVGLGNPMKTHLGQQLQWRISPDEALEHVRLWFLLCSRGSCKDWVSAECWTPRTPKNGESKALARGTLITTIVSDDSNGNNGADESREEGFPLFQSKGPDLAPWALANPFGASRLSCTWSRMSTSRYHSSIIALS